MKRRVVICAALIASTVLAGCNKDEQQANKGNEATQSTTHDEQPVASVLMPSDVDAQSPATLGAEPDSSSEAPEEVVTKFLEALRSGNDQLAKRLLSDQARQSTANEGYEVRPLGTPSAVYEVGAAEFVSEAKGAAHVPSQWTETFGDGSTEAWDITWVLRRQPHAGWRITGMRAQLFPNAPKRFLNFENAAEMKRQLAQAEQELATERDGVRQASSQGDPSTGQVRNAFPE